MELWIRSQQKDSIIKANNSIRIIETKGLKERLENSFLSCLSDMAQVQDYLKDGWTIMVDDTNVGIYQTKERALEVLDEIQNALLENDRYDYSFPPSISNITGNSIFEMPKE